MSERSLKKGCLYYRLFLGLATFWFATMAQGAGFQDSIAEHQLRLDQAIQRLNTTRTDVLSKQIPLSKRLSEVSDATRELRAETAELRSQRAERELDLRDLESRVNGLEEEFIYIGQTLFGEYFADYEASLSVGERKAFGDLAREALLYSEMEGAVQEESLSKGLAAVRTSLDQLMSVLGGKVYEGDSLNENGLLVSGKFLQAGPSLFFAAKDRKEGGVVEDSLSLRPRLRRLEKDGQQQIIDFAFGGGKMLPIDPSLGNALLLAGTHDGFFEHLRRGGIWVYPIVFFALLSSLVAVCKFIQIFKIRQPAPAVAHELSRLLREGKGKEAWELASQQPQPARGMLLSAVEHAKEPVELIEEFMYESMLSVQPRLERFLNVIAVTAATAPLLGLLGTVTGIIKTFKLMNVFGAGDPKPLISGISEALITTELGLVLAIPALLAHALLSRKAAGVLARMEKLSLAFLNSFSRRGEDVKSA